MANNGKIAFLVAAEGIEQAELVEPWAAVADPDNLRQDTDAVALVRDFVESGKPVAAICHAAWTLVEADVVRGRRLTSWPSLQTDVRNAGGEWVDEQVVVDGNLITSRKPDDIPAFNACLLEAVNHGVSSAASAVASHPRGRGTSPATTLDGAPPAGA